jgi:hypothetical protein
MQIQILVSGTDVTKRFQTYRMTLKLGNLYIQNYQLDSVLYSASVNILKASGKYMCHLL